jgi:hypothetical protein
MATEAADNLPEYLKSLVAKTSANTSSDATVTQSVAVPTGTGVQIVPANPNRIGLILYNNSANSIYIRYGSPGTSATCTTVIATFAQWVMPQPIYTGALTACRNAGTGNVIYTEMA